MHRAGSKSSGAGRQARVSVVIPVYNARDFLGQAVESVLSQGHSDLELILVDDGSTDGSGDLCRHYAGLDARVRVISQPNRGPAAARNAGVRQAKGDFLFFLDADDFLAPGALEELLDLQGQHDAALVMSGFAKLETHGGIVVPRVARDRENNPFGRQVNILSTGDVIHLIENFLKYPSNHIISYCWAKLYHAGLFREFRLSFREEMSLFEDYVFNLHYMTHAPRIVFVDKPLYYYRMHRQHVSASMAPLAAEQMLHDMGIFRKETYLFFQRAGWSTALLPGRVGHALTHYLIIFLIRWAVQLSMKNHAGIARETTTLLRNPFVQDCLRHYVPYGRYSRMVPVLMRHQWTYPLLLFAKYKGYLRYGTKKERQHG